MTFLVPLLAVGGVLAMAIPIAIHLLFRRRKRPVEWAAMRQLLEAVRRTSRRLRLEQLLLLAVRCALVLLLGVALAQPLLKAAGVMPGGLPRVVFLVVDDSLASGARGADGATALEGQIERAVSIVRALDPSDAVGVVTAARPARGLVIPPSTDHGSIVRLLESMTPADAPADMPAAMAELRLASDALGTGVTVAAYLLSDFRAGSATLDTPLPPVLDGMRQSDVTLLASPPAEEPISNVQVVGIDPLRSVLLPGQADGSGQVTVRLARGGDRLDRAVSTVRLGGPDIRPVESRVLQWEAGQSAGSVVFQVEPIDPEQSALGLVATVDEDALPGDDRRFAVAQARRQIRVALLDRRAFGFDPGLDRLGPGQWMARALRPFEQSPIEVTTVDPTTLDSRSIRGVDALLLARPDLLDDEGWSIVGDHVDRGGLLLVAPPVELNVHLWVDRLVESLGLPWTVGIETVVHDPGLPLAEQQPSSELLRLIAGELPQLARPVDVFRRLPIDSESSRASTVLALTDGSPLAIAGAPVDDEGRSTRGMVILLATAPELSWTNLPAKPFMVPLMQELVRQGVGLTVAGQRSTVGDRPVLERAATTVERLGDGEDDELTVAVDGSGRPSAPLSRAGLYRQVDPAQLEVGLLAVNVDPAAGNTERVPPDAVAAWLGESGSWLWLDDADPAAPLRAADGAASIAGALLVAVLVLAVLETILARRFSHAGVRLATGSDTGTASFGPTQTAGGTPS